MNPTKLRHVLAKPQDWKTAMQKQLNARNISRYAFIRECSSMGICSIHTGECLLADADRATGRRNPSLEVAIGMASVAGLQIQMVGSSDPKDSSR